MYDQGGDGRGGVIIDPITGEVVNRLTGEVIGHLIEGVDYPARPRAGNTRVIVSVKSRGKLSTLTRMRSSMSVGVKDDAQERARAIKELANRIEEVMVRYGIKIHRVQAEVIAEGLEKSGRPSRYLNVLDCVLDVKCNKYLLERRQVREIIEGVLGSDWLLKQHIKQVLKQWNIEGLNTEDIYKIYIEVRRTMSEVRRAYPEKTLIELSITLHLIKTLGKGRAREILAKLGREKLRDKLRELRLATP